MTDQQIALGQRAVACPGWRWMPGMLACDTAGMYVRVATVEDDGIPVEWSHKPPDGLSRVITSWGTPGWAADVWSKAVPILEDPATLGCITTLAREALGEPLAHVVPFPTHVSDPIFGGLVPALWWAISTTADSAARFFPNDDGPSWAMAGPAPEDAWLAALEAAGRR